jgi:nucleolin
MTDALSATNGWKGVVLSVLTGTKGALKLKELRKQVLISLQLDETDKAAKKTFKKTVKALEESEELSIDAEGLVCLLAKGKKRKLKEERKSKKRRTESEENSDTLETGDTTQSPVELDETSKPEADRSNESKGKNVPCKGNPQGCTRLFLGNLPFAVDESLLGSFLKEKASHIKWITDKETGKFYGSAFVEMQDATSAADVVMSLAGQSLLGRPIKINYAPARPGDLWPPEKKVVTGGATITTPKTGGQAGGTGIKAMSEKPENCVKLFIGNLSYEIDDDAISKFFETAGAEVKAVRWIHHKDTGDFKGVGFVEFWNTEACDKAAALNGKNLLGRPIRIDWTD